MSKKDKDADRQLRIARGTVISGSFLIAGTLTLLLIGIAIVTESHEQATLLMALATGASVSGQIWLLTIHAKVLGINDTYRTRECKRADQAEEQMAVMTTLVIELLKTHCSEDAETDTEEHKMHYRERYEQILGKFAKLEKFTGS